MLIKNELYKIFKKKKIYVSIVIVLIVLFSHAYLVTKGNMIDIGDWIQLMKTQLDSTVFVIFVMVIMFSADTFSEDYTLGTIKMLFVRPKKRVSIFISKLASSFIILIFLLLIVLVVSALLNTFLFDAPLLNQHMSYDADSGESVEKSYIFYIIQMFLAHIVEVGIYIFIASMIAIILKHSSVAIIICLIANFAVAPILSLLSIFENIGKFVPYVLFYNTDLSQYINNGSNYLDTSIWFSITILLVYVALFLFISYKVYCKRDVY